MRLLGPAFAGQIVAARGACRPRRQWLEHLFRDNRELGSFGALYWLGTLD